VHCNKQTTSSPTSHLSKASIIMKDSGEHSTDALCASSLSSGLGKALIEGKYPDVTITCGNREFKVHRLVVCTQSAWFDLAFTTPPKVCQ